MRISYPDTFTYDDRLRFTLPALSFVVEWHGDAVGVPPNAPPAEVDTLMAALRAYDRAMPTIEEADTTAFLLRLRAHRLAGMTPEQVYQDFQDRLTTATTLAGMKAILVEALPLMAAGIIALWRHRE